MSISAAYSWAVQDLCYGLAEVLWALKYGCPILIWKDTQCCKMFVSFTLLGIHLNNLYFKTTPSFLIWIILINNACFAKPFDIYSKCNLKSWPIARVPDRYGQVSVRIGQKPVQGWLNHDGFFNLFFIPKINLRFINMNVKKYIEFSNSKVGFFAI